MLTPRKVTLFALACVSALCVGNAARATTISSSGTFSGTVSSNAIGFGLYSQSQNLSGVDNKFGAFTETASDDAAFSSFTDFSIVSGSETATFSGGKIFANFSGNGSVVAGGYDATSSFDITGGTGAFAGITGTIQDTTFLADNGTFSGNYSGTYSGLISPVPLPGSVGMFGTALLGLIGLGMRKPRRTIVA
jgi:hypothetical protein